MKMFITENFKQTQKLGEMLVEEIKDGRIVCMTGELGSGKTTFTQGLLKGLKVKGPYTSPTFLIMKHYKKEIPNPKSQIPNKSKISNYKIQNIYHVDAYRVKSEDVINLGWEEIINQKNSVIIIEWADRIEKIIPPDAIWIEFRWLDENRREITFLSRHPELERSEERRIC